MSHNVDYIKSRSGGEQQFIRELIKMAEERTQKVDNLVRSEITLYSKFIEIVRGMAEGELNPPGIRETMVENAQNRITFLEKVLSNNDGSLKETLLKEGLLKDGVLKDGVLKDGVLKNGLLKDTLLKEGVLKEGVLKIGLLKDGLMKEGLMKDAMLDSEEIAPTESILKQSSEPKVGISKQDYINILGSASAPISGRVSSGNTHLQTPVTERGKMYFALVFAESCASYITDELISKSNSDLKNIHKIVASDSSGINSYKTLNYDGVLGDLHVVQRISTKFTQELAKIAKTQAANESN